MDVLVHRPPHCVGSGERSQGRFTSLLRFESGASNGLSYAAAAASAKPLEASSAYSGALEAASFASLRVLKQAWRSL